MERNNEKCATVDKNGNITAVAPGTAKIELLIGDGTVYTSKAVTVYVTGAKTFTYAEQKSWKEITTVTMKPGEQYDIKFIGVSDWRNYSRQWKSSNEKCATVDKNGNITAVAAGTAKIELLIGDGTVYTSEAVTVYVAGQKSATTSKPTATPTPRPTSKVSENYTGLGEKSGKINYYVDGKIDRQFVGLAEFEGKYYYVKNGSIDERFTGVAYDEDGLWYVTKGVVDTGYNGTVEYNGNELVVVNGKIDSEFVRAREDVILDSPIAMENHKKEISSIGYTAEKDKYILSEPGVYKIRYSKPMTVSDKFGKIVARGEQTWNGWYYSSDARSVFFISPVAEDTYFVSRYDYYSSSGYMEYACPIVDVSGATIVNDAYDSEYEHASDYGPSTSYNSPNEWRLFRCYEYVPEESGEYTLSFDNIEISKGKEKYSENRLFSCRISSDDTWNHAYGEDEFGNSTDHWERILAHIYVNGNGTCTSNLEKGKNIISNYM